MVSVGKKVDLWNYHSSAFFVRIDALTYSIRFGWMGADANMFLFASFAACAPKMLAPVGLPT
jgi:hypothetical protein